MSDSRDLELLVTRIQQQLAPQAEVLHDVKLDGRDSKTKRQIDVLVRERIGQYEIQIIIDCKDYKKPVDVKGVEEFVGLFQDVRAQKGVLVCPRGFTDAAKRLAEHKQIDLYSPVDTEPHKWTVRVTMPATCDFRNVVMSFGVRFSTPLPLKLQPDFYSSSIVFDSEGKALGKALEAASKKWNDGDLPREVGEHRNLPIFDTMTVYIDNGYGMRVPIDMYVSTLVRRDLYFGQLPIPRMSGFKDELSGKIITNAFQIGMLDPDQVEREWQKINSEEDAPVTPVIAMVGSVLWGEDGEKL